MPFSYILLRYNNNIIHNNNNNILQYFLIFHHTIDLVFLINHRSKLHTSILWFRQTWLKRQSLATPTINYRYQSRQQTKFLTIKDEGSRKVLERSSGIGQTGMKVFSAKSRRAQVQQSKSWRRHCVRIVEQKESFVCLARIYCLTGMSSVSATDIDEWIKRKHGVRIIESARVRKIQKQYYKTRWLKSYSKGTTNGSFNRHSDKDGTLWRLFLHRRFRKFAFQETILSAIG